MFKFVLLLPSIVCLLAFRDVRLTTDLKGQLEGDSSVFTSAKTHSVVAAGKVPLSTECECSNFCAVESCTSSVCPSTAHCTVISCIDCYPFRSFIHFGNLSRQKHLTIFDFYFLLCNVIC